MRSRSRSTHAAARSSPESFADPRFPEKRDLRETSLPNNAHAAVSAQLEPARNNSDSSAGGLGPVASRHQARKLQAVAIPPAIVEARRTDRTNPYSRHTR